MHHHQQENHIEWKTLQWNEFFPSDRLKIAIPINGYHIMNKNQVIFNVYTTPWTPCVNFSSETILYTLHKHKIFKNKIASF